MKKIIQRVTTSTRTTQIIRTMKISAFLLLVSVFPVIVSTAYSQDGEVVFKQKKTGQNIFANNSDSVFFTTGFKIGEVTDTSVIIWTRLCKNQKPVPIKHLRKEAPFRSPIDFDNNMPVNEMEGAVEGSLGQVKITISSKGKTVSTEWEYVSADKDYTLKKKINGLQSNTAYTVLLQGRKDEKSPIAEKIGQFRTAPRNNEIIPVTFTANSDQYFWDYDDSLRGFKIYDNMMKLKPLFHCEQGDFVYYDKKGPTVNTIEMARHDWHAMNSWPSLVDFYSKVPLYIQKDDHDALRDDATPKIAPLGEVSFSDGVRIWQEQMPVIGKPYRTFRWGKDLQIWLVEGREFRSENSDPDGPEKSLWGKEQKQWFVESIKSSDATFKLLMSPTPVVGPDRGVGKKDNLANDAWKTEGDWLRKFLSEQKNTYVINGDRHWQYVSKDIKTGLMEFDHGPASDSHAQGWSQDDLRPEHKFLRVKGGFLGVNIYREKNVPFIKFTLYDVDGNKVHEDIIKAIL